MDIKQQWIDIGYEHFALFGPEKLSVNKISKETGSSRACFYHYFGDMDVFIEELLDMHWQSLQQFYTDGVLVCKNIFPDFYLLLEQYPIPLQFNRQLFLHRNKPAFNYLFDKSFRVGSERFILKLFSKQFDLHYSDEDISNLWLSFGESWYSRLDPNDLSAASMQQLGEEVLSSVLKFISSDLYSKMWRTPL